MLRINLLPPYIYEGAKRRNVTVLWVVILLAVIGGLVFAKMNIDKETQNWKDEEGKITQRANDADRMAQDATTINGQSATIRGKADFVRNAQKHDTTTYQEVLTNIARYTWPRVLYDGVKPDVQAVTLPAYAPTLSDVGHYMIYMERNPNISRVDVQIASIPGFPSGVRQQGANNQQATGVRPLTGGGHDFTAVLSLNKPIDGGPNYPGGGGNAAGGATTGGGGFTGGAPGGFSSGMASGKMGGGMGGSGGPSMSGGGGGPMPGGGK